MTLRDRVHILNTARNGGPVAQAKHRELCRRRCAFFINTCLDIFEPRAPASARDLPYLLRKFQESVVEQVVKHILDGEDLLIDKTREMGVTWLVEAVLLWCLIFQNNFTGIVSSITEKKIDDKGNPSTLFWKIDYMLDSVIRNAPWVLPPDYKPDYKNRNHMKLYYPPTNSLISGEVMGDNFGRSGRANCIFLDEFAEAEFPSATWASCSRTTNCRLVVFTPKGLNFAGRLANPPRGQAATIDKITLHWILDPSKNTFLGYDAAGNVIATGAGKVSPAWLAAHPGVVRTVYPWYEDAKRRVANDPVRIAQELDVNYEESAENQMYPQIVRSRKLDSIPYDPSFPLYCSMDYGLSDMTALIWVQWHPFEKRFKVIDAYQNHGKTIAWYVPFITGRNLTLGQSQGGYTERDLEVINRHRQFMGRYSDFFGDPSGRFKNQVSATSVTDVLSENGIDVRCNHYANSFIARKYGLGSILPLMDFSMDYCSDLVEAMQDYRMNNQGKPIHGLASHFATSLEFFAVNQPHGNTGDLPTTESELFALSSSVAGSYEEMGEEKMDGRKTRWYPGLPESASIPNAREVLDNILSEERKRDKIREELTKQFTRGINPKTPSGGWGNSRRRKTRR